MRLLRRRRHDGWRMEAPIRMSRYVICNATITSPAPSPGFMAVTGLGPNLRCGHTCKVVNEAPVMQFKCPLGHTFIASPADIREDR